MGAGATPQTGASAALAVLNGQKVDTRGWVLDNGAGLSREGRVTADGLAGMLDTAWHSPLMPEFISSLAISGVDGTVKRRLRDDEVKGMAHLKTGTLRDVRALAGYVLGASGKRYVLVSIVNDDRSAGVRAFDDALVSWLAAR
jgi:D-alanyl-D-alanine carboxypeptidase/D-alanyl-D-alanine-endopeptidase (penicillin-binding protein 4)